VVASAAERRSRSRYRRLTLDDARWLEERMRTPGVVSAAWSASTPAAAGGRKLAGVTVSGATPGLFYVNGVAVTEGRPFTDHEAERGLPVAVIGRDVADRLFPGASALGRRVYLAGLSYRVVGVLARQGKLFAISMDRTAIVPARSPLNGAVVPRDVAEVIAFKVPRSSLLPAAMAEMEGWMRVRKGLRPGDANDFSVTTSERALAAWGRISRVMMVAVPCLIGISLLVAGLVIMNIMLVSVTERTYEIGVRKALGARGRDVLLQFLVEAGTLSGLGGVLGVVAGLGLAWLVTALSPLPAQVAPWSAGLGLLLGVGVGIAAGVYPARRAARLDPVAALGHE
jgi:putative ABC transport system permease protein